MNTASKILFWIFTIALGFVNPLISVALVVLYYLPGIIQSAVVPCDETTYEEYEEPKQTMNEFSDDIREKMR
jgi:hypothetical protein